MLLLQLALNLVGEFVSLLICVVDNIFNLGGTHFCRAVLHLLLQLVLTVLGQQNFGVLFLLLSQLRLCFLWRIIATLLCWFSLAIIHGVHKLRRDHESVHFLLKVQVLVASERFEILDP